MTPIFLGYKRTSRDVGKRVFLSYKKESKKEKKGGGQKEERN